MGALAAALVVAAASAASQPPPPSGGHHIAKPQPNASTVERQRKPPEPATSSPVVVGIGANAASRENAPNKEAEDRKKESAHHWWAEADWWVAIFTGVLAFITGALAYFTFQLWRDAGKGATVAQAAFLAAHRPRLVVRRVSLGIAKGRGVNDVPGAEYVIANIGDTAAKIFEINVAMWLPLRGSELPAIPPYGESTFPDASIESGQTLPNKHYIPAPISNAAEFNLGFAGDEPLFLLGYIDYVDGGGRKRRTAFLRKYDYTTGRFDAINHPDYEYQD